MKVEGGMLIKKKKRKRKKEKRKKEFRPKTSVLRIMKGYFDEVKVT